MLTTGQRGLALGLVAAGLLLAIGLGRNRVPGPRLILLAVATTGGSLLWLFGQEAYEGPTVVAASATRGLAIADLGVPPTLALALATLSRWILAHTARGPVLECR